MAAERDGKAKKKVVKTKLSKPNPKSKQHQYSIEIAPNMVKIVRVDVKGRIISTGIAPLDGDPLWSDKSWINRLSQSVRDAARDARVPKGSSHACSVVAGGPQIIMQRFTWPELVHSAMVENSRHEIASYLPGVSANFVVGAEVQKKNDADGDNIATMDVFVAAMPKDMATAISTAVTWAGFKVASLDVSENVRARLVKHCSRGDVPKSFGVLDLSSVNPNITLYLDGFFYSTHYFTGSQSNAPAGATIDEIESLMGSLDSSKASATDKQIEYNVEAMLGEISFVVDFIRYQERGSNLEAILIMGRTQPGFAERLSAGLDMPVLSNDAWMRSSIIEDVKGDPGLFLDPYASSLPSTVIAANHMMDLKTVVMVKNPARRLFAVASGLMFVLLSVLAVGLLIPFMTERRLQNEYNDLDELEATVQRIVAMAHTQAQVDERREELEFIETRVDGIDAFYDEFAQAAVVVPVLFDSGFSRIQRIDATEDRILVSARTDHFNHLADMVDYLRQHSLFRTARTINIVTEEDTTRWEEGTTTFDIEIFQERRAGAQR
jgi:Tfp pilus assembly protein PilN/Tfp pilus assembly PilM family ATPase